MIVEDEVKLNGKASEGILKSLAGYKKELEGARRLETALKNIALPASIEELMEDFTMIDGIAQAADIQEEPKAPIAGAPPITLFGKDLETMDDDALISHLSLSFTLDGLNYLYKKAEYQIHEGVSEAEAIEVLENKLETLQASREDVRNISNLSNQEAAKKAQKLSQAIQALEVLIDEINIDAGFAVAEGKPQLEDITPVTVKLGDIKIDENNAADMRRKIRLKYQELPEGTDPTLDDLGITIEDDLGHTALKQLQAQLAVQNHRDGNAINDVWYDYSVSEEDITLMSEAYSGLTILHRAVINEMKRLDLDYIGEAIDIWNFKAQVPAPINPGVAG